MRKNLIIAYRSARVLIRQLLQLEPYIKVKLPVNLEWHGNEYCGWCIPVNALSRKSIVVDVGLGEDVSFSRSLIEKYGCTVHGLDPTPRATKHIKDIKLEHFILHSYGMAKCSGSATFYLPNNTEHVSGSLVSAKHVGKQTIEVQILSLLDTMKLLEVDHIDLLKIDIEGTEYEIFQDSSFHNLAAKIGIICVEFHHRWPEFTRRATEDAVNKLSKYGYQCVWVNRQTNEEFTFIRHR